MDRLFNSTEKIGDIAVKFPKAMEVFRDYNIDFCCGGDRLLSDAIKEANLNEEEVISKLEEAYNKLIKAEGETDWSTASYSELIDYVVNTHHAYLTRTMPKLSELTTKILRVHGAHHGELAKVHKLFHSLKMELDAHLIKEEEIIFPMIKEFEVNPSVELFEKAEKIINEIESEHDEAGNILKELRKITSQYSVPSDGCSTYALTYNLLEEMEGDLFRHIHLENNILHPRFHKEREKFQG